MDSKYDDISFDGENVDPEPRHRLGGIYKRGIDSQTLNSKNIKHTFSLNDVVLTGTASVEESGPPSPQSGPPSNFGLVEESIYRSSFPQDCNISFLESLNLKAVLTLVGTELTSEFISFMARNNIQHYRIKIPPHKVKEDQIPPESIALVMRMVLDPSNHPILIHCNKGKHRTGCMTACYRKIQGIEDPRWNVDNILTEYHKYADPKARPYDEAFISRLNAREVLDTVNMTEKIQEPIRYSIPDLGEKHLKLIDEAAFTEGSQIVFAFPIESQEKKLLPHAFPYSGAVTSRYGLDPQVLTTALRKLSTSEFDCDTTASKKHSEEAPSASGTEFDNSANSSPLRRCR